MPTALLNGVVRTYTLCEAEANTILLATSTAPAACLCASSESMSAHKTIFGIYSSGVTFASSGSGLLSFMWGMSADAVRCASSMFVVINTIQAISGIVSAVSRVSGHFGVTGMVNNVRAACYCTVSVSGSLRKLAGYVISSGRIGRISDSRRVR